MTTETRTEAVPSIHAPSRLGLVRDLFIIAFCTAIVGGFLAQVWHAPQPTPTHVGDAERAAAVHPRV